MDGPGADAHAAAQRWAQTWQRAWAAHDAAAIGALYADGATFRPHPFRPALPVDDYLRDVFADEVAAEPAFDAPLVDGNRASVRWSATTMLRDGRRERLVGVSLLEFDPGGLVVDQADVWLDGEVTG